MSDTYPWEQYPLHELEEKGIATLGRGNIISKKDIQSNPGGFPIYSSSAKGEGLFGTYGDYMFDDEMITWSVDGGGNLFYRPRHKFSVTNVSGYMRLDTSVLDYRFAHASLALQHSKLTFDYQTKAHPSVIRNLYHLPIPPLPEQKKIAEILNSLQTAKIKSEEKYARLEKFYSAISRNLFEDLLATPLIAKSPASDLCSVITKGTTPIKIQNGQSRKQEVPFLRVTNIDFSGRINPCQDFQFIDEETHGGALRRSICKPGDILMNIVGPPLGKVGIIPEAIGECNINQAVLVYRPIGELVSLDFFAHYLLSSIAQDWLKSQSKKTSGQQNLTIETCKDLLVPVPVKFKQEQINSLLGGIKQEATLLRSKIGSLETLLQGTSCDLLSGRKRVSI